MPHSILCEQKIELDSLEPTFLEMVSGDRLYVIYQNDARIWNKAYTTFELALDVVERHVNEINEVYTRSPEYNATAPLPAQLVQEGEGVTSGLMVAKINSRDVQIFIKEVEF